tara:strand:+ start:119 stop:514 length:396 start_codon:yes stop_codon:yes gene_type:complete
MVGFNALEQIQRTEREIGTDNEDGGSVITIVVGRGHDIACPTNAISPGMREQMAHVTFGTQTRTRRHSCHGQQDSKDRLGRSDPQRPLHASHCLKEKEQRVSKTRELMVHKPAAKTKTTCRKSRAQLPAKL